MKLLIVESPAKCKTIKKYLGPGYEVLASYGHIRDLAHDKHFFGVDIQNGFQPHFETLKNKYKYITALKNALKTCDTVYLASDDDREGEAIAWHLCQVLKLNPTTNPRIVFREITKDAITKALEKPGTLDMNMVFSQQARQILDKLVGFELCPLLWKHISSGLNLSAGRVQSVVTKLVIDREKEIEDFSSQSFFKVSGKFQHKPLKFDLNAELTQKLENGDECKIFLEKCLNAQFRIFEVPVKEEDRNPKPPFITSTLQQEAGNRLGFSTKTTMSVAQKLYEKGKITYMRTDSTNISKGFQDQVKKFVTEKYGPEYLRLKQWTKKVKGGQEAHECIRPTDANEVWVGGDFTPLEKKLYRIIWQRTMASQMTPQRVEVTKLHIGIYPIVEKVSQEKLSQYFKSQFEKELFPGFTIIYKGGNLLESVEAGGENQTEDLEENNSIELIQKNTYETIIKKIKIGDVLDYLEISATQKYTEPQPRFTEASLVKMLENKGIGRPSTYSSMVSKIQEKQYVSKENIPSKTLPTRIFKIENGKNIVQNLESTWKTRAENNKLVPTDIGKIVTTFLVEHFDKIMDYGFTSGMEEKLDLIAQGEVVWNDMIKEYYDSFHPKVMLLQESKTSGILGESKDLIDGKKSTIVKAKDKFQRLLGAHPQNGENIYVTMARYGPCLQIGDDPKKSQYVSIGKGAQMDKITFEEALKIIQFPKNLGEIEEEDVIIKKGPYGFYIQWKTKKVSIPKEINIDDVDLEAAKKIIKNKEEGNESWILTKFQDGAETIQVLKGKFGPYIKKGTKNISLKGKTEEEAKKLNLEEIKKIIEDYIVNGPPKSSRGRGQGRGGSTRGGSTRGGKITKKVTTTKKILPVIKKKEI